MREEIKERIEMIKRCEVPEGYKNTEVGIFPYNWDELKLSQLLRFQNGINADKEKFGNGVKIVSVMDVLNQNAITYENISGMIDIDEEMLERYSVSYGDVLFQRSSENIEDAGKSNIYMDDKNIATFGGFVIRGKKIADYNPIIFNEILKRQYVRKQIKKLAAGVQHINISQESLREVSVVIPNEESQNYIEDIINIYQKLEKQQDNLIEQKMLYKKWLMQNLLTGKKRIKKFDNKWKSMRLSELCRIEKGAQINGDMLSDSGSYYMLNGGVQPSGYVEKWNCTEDTISISEGGNSCGYINYNTEKFWSGGHCYTLQEIDENIDTQYLYQFLKLKQRKIMDLRVGSGLPNIQKKSLENFKVVVPKLEEQIKISRVLMKADKEIELLQQQREQTDLEKKAMLQLLLTGIVRVDQKGDE